MGRFAAFANLPNGRIGNNILESLRASFPAGESMELKPMKSADFSQGHAGNGVAFRIEKKTAAQGHTTGYAPDVCYLQAVLS